jgi:hypothetical protein
MDNFQLPRFARSKKTPRLTRRFCAFGDANVF